jgi:EGF domain/EGF-like domain
MGPRQALPWIPACSTQRPCGANATCSNSPGTYSCKCNSGFDGNGVTCTAHDYCRPNPCVNGRCTSLSDRASCDCTGTDYSGSKCERKIDDCASSPCMNGGTCNDGLRSYLCQCTRHYTGTRCESDICEGVNCTTPFVCTHLSPTDPGAGNAPAFCAASCYPNCAVGQRCIRPEDCSSRKCDAGACVSDVDVCAGVNCSPPFVCIPVRPSDPGAGNAAALCSAPCYPNCPAGQRCIRHEDCTSRNCDFGNGGVCM